MPVRKTFKKLFWTKIARKGRIEIESLHLLLHIFTMSKTDRQLLCRKARPRISVMKTNTALVFLLLSSHLQNVNQNANSLEMWLCLFSLLYFFDGLFDVCNNWRSVFDTIKRLRYCCIHIFTGTEDSVGDLFQMTSSSKNNNCKTMKSLQSGELSLPTSTSVPNCKGTFLSEGTDFFCHNIKQTNIFSSLKVKITIWVTVNCLEIESILKFESL